MNSFASVWRPILEPRPSRIKRSLLILFYFLALVSLLQAVLPLHWLLAAFAVWLVLLGLEFSSWRHDPRIVLLHERTGDWWLADHAGETARMRLMKAMVWRYLVVLDFRALERAGPRRCRVVLFADSIATDDFRRLRVRLLQGPPPGKQLRE